MWRRILQRLSEKEDKKEDFTKIFQSIYHASLLAGIILSILYFTFSAQALPVFKDFSSIASYLIAVFGVALLFAVFIAGVFVLPSLFFNSQLLGSENKSIFLKVYAISYVISQLVILIYLVIHQCRHEVCMATIKCADEYLSIILTLCTIVFIITLFTKIGIYLYPIIMSLIVQIPLFILVAAALFETSGFLAAKNFEIAISMYFILIVIVGVILYITNRMFLEGVNLDNFEGLKKSFNHLTLILFLVLSLIFGVYMIFEKPNPIIIKPFEVLKLGHYRAELHFKKDFIEKSNPFVSNETNQTKNVFFVWSSVGDEYILQEIAPGHYVEHNRTFVEVNVGDIKYRYNEQNNSEVYRVIDRNCTKDENSLKKYWQEQIKKPNRVYRIKKENVELEVVGQDVEPRGTVWERKPMQKPKEKPKPKVQNTIKCILIDCNSTKSVH